MKGASGMKKDDTNDLGVKEALNEDSLAQVAGGSYTDLTAFSIPVYIIKCRVCDWEQSGSEPSVLKALARSHTQKTGHETYFSS
jgi:hypothetical protein